MGELDPISPVSVAMPRFLLITGRLGDFLSEMMMNNGSPSPVSSYPICLIPMVVQQSPKVPCTWMTETDVIGSILPLWKEGTGVDQQRVHLSVAVPSAMREEKIVMVTWAITKG